MRTSLLRFSRALLTLILAPFLLAVGAVALAITDLAWLVAGRRRKPVNVQPETRAASLVIPNWNGKDLLERLSALLGSRHRRTSRKRNRDRR